MDITVALVRQLVSAQFPEWAHHTITPVASDGWDNRTFHLGDTMLVRLPSAAGYAGQVANEQRWLPYLAPRLPFPIPAPLAQGQPTDTYPWPWSIYRWLDGQSAALEPVTNLHQFGSDIAHFLGALQRIPAAGGPPPGPHNGWRGSPLTIYDAETRQALALLAEDRDTRALTAAWDSAVTSVWRGPPVWIHGDMAIGNLLVKDGRLYAVIDFGCLAVGDPACDLAIAWTYLDEESRHAFRSLIGVDDGTWARGRGWALWKALITLAAFGPTLPAQAAAAHRVIDSVLAQE